MQPCPKGQTGDDGHRANTENLYFIYCASSSCVLPDACLPSLPFALSQASTCSPTTTPAASPFTSTMTTAAACCCAMRRARARRRRRRGRREDRRFRAAWFVLRVCAYVCVRVCACAYACVRARACLWDFSCARWYQIALPPVYTVLFYFHFFNTADRMCRPSRSDRVNNRSRAHKRVSPQIKPQRRNATKAV